MKFDWVDYILFYSNVPLISSNLSTVPLHRLAQPRVQVVEVDRDARVRGRRRPADVLEGQRRVDRAVAAGHVERGLREVADGHELLLLAPAKNTISGGISTMFE